MKLLIFLFNFYNDKQFQDPVYIKDHIKHNKDCYSYTPFLGQMSLTPIVYINVDINSSSRKVKGLKV